MVRIVDSKKIEKEDGTAFYALIVQGGVEVVISQETGKPYFTAKKAHMASTFDEETCRSLVGTELAGSIKRVSVEPFEYLNKETGERILLSHRNEYVSEDQTVLEANVVDKTVVI